jgi:hypothetical protein
MAQQKIPLAELVGAVTGQLREAQENARKRGFAAMIFDECEFEFGIEAEADEHGGFHVWVIELGGGVKRTETNSIRITFKSNPEYPIATE